MAYGANSGEDSRPAPARNQTMVFGAATVAAPPANQTVAFGTAALSGASTPKQPAVSQTIAFGAPALSANRPAPSKPSAPAAPPVNQTLVFGAKAVVPKTAVSPTTTEEMSAQLEGISSDRTVRVDVSSLKFSSETPAPQAPAHNRTVMFAGGATASSDAQATLNPDEGDEAARLTRDSAGSTTEPGRQFALDGMASGLEASAGDLARADLPPDPAFSAHGGFGDSLSESTKEQYADLDSRSVAKRRSVASLVVIAILSLVVLALAAAVLWKFFGQQLLNPAVSFETRQQFESSLALLRLDDTASKQGAVEALGALSSKQPQFTEAMAALVLARALQFDDVQQRSLRLESKATALEAKTTATAEAPDSKAEASPSTAAEALRTELKALKPELESAKRQLENDSTLLDTLLTATNSKEAMQWILRANAVTKAVLADAEALALTQRFRAQSPEVTQDTWLELAEPEYYANAQSSQEAREQARAQLDRLRSASGNSTLVRTYVIQARLWLKDGSFEEAEEALSQVVTMRSNHDVAQELLAWAQAEHKAKAQ
jgi:hypothetical protein